MKAWSQVGSGLLFWCFTLGVLVIVLKSALPTMAVAGQTKYKPEPVQGEDVIALRYSPNGQWLATAEMNGMVRLWNTQNHRNVAVLQGPGQLVRGLAFSGDGASLACGCDDGDIYLWETCSARRRATLKGHSGMIFSVAFASDGKTLASCCGSYENGKQTKPELKVWDIHEDKRIREIECHDELGGGLTFVLASKLLAVACMGQFNGVKVLDSTTGKEVKRFTYDEGFPIAIAISPDGKWVATGGGTFTKSKITGHLKVWDWETGAARQTLVAKSDWYCRAVAFSKDSTRLVSGTQGPPITIKAKNGVNVSTPSSRLQCWDTSTWNCLWTEESGSGSVNSVDMAPDGLTVAVSNRAGTMLIDATAGRMLRYLITGPHKVD
jgi:WD40 repeat protein